MNNIYLKIIGLTFVIAMAAIVIGWAPGSVSSANAMVSPQNAAGPMPQNSNHTTMKKKKHHHYQKHKKNAKGS